MQQPPVRPPLPFEMPDLLEWLLHLDREMAEAAPFKPKNYRRTGKLDLLFVDDQHFMRQMVMTLLGGADLTMRFAYNAMQAVEAYIERPPHMVFLDIEMPGINGLELLKIIVRNDPKAYPIMLTGDVTQQYVAFAKEHGAKGYVGKPFTRQGLLDCVERYLGEMGLKT